MIWKFKCTVCKEWREIDWDRKDIRHTCHKTRESYYPPNPAEQHDAYLDSHDWTLDMEEIVVKFRGERCVVPGCIKHYETLDHRVPYSEGGKTSVKNLFPICFEHNDAKGDMDYDDWLADYYRKINKVIQGS